MGRFVVLEGLDGAGTTTQSARLATDLRARGRQVVETREPTDLPVGRLIRAALRRDPEAVDLSTLPWMFAADRADHLARVVEPALARGAWVVSDRYLPSSLAYQSLDRPLEQVDALNRWFRLPDLLVFVEVPVEVCLARITARGLVREVFEQREALEAISARYEAVNALLRERGAHLVVVDGDRPVDEVQAAIRAAVQGLR